MHLYSIKKSLLATFLTSELLLPYPHCASGFHKRFFLLFFSEFSKQKVYLLQISAFNFLLLYISDGSLPFPSHTSKILLMIYFSRFCFTLLNTIDFLSVGKMAKSLSFSTSIFTFAKELSSLSISTTSFLILIKSDFAIQMINMFESLDFSKRLAKVLCSLSKNLLSLNIKTF